MCNLHASVCYFEKKKRCRKKTAKSAERAAAKAPAPANDLISRRPNPSWQRGRDGCDIRTDDGRY